MNRTIHCTICGEEVDLTEKYPYYSDDNREKCPSCGNTKLYTLDELYDLANAYVAQREAEKEVF